VTHRLAAPLLLAALAWARPASAETSMGVGTDLLLDPRRGAVQVTMAADIPVLRHFTVGGRGGLILEAPPASVALPLDLRLRAHLGRWYVDALGGPWFGFRQGNALRLHAGLGFGLVIRDFTFGLELGWLDRSAMAGVRLAVPM
jgi:hypothetical protein